MTQNDINSAVDVIVNGYNDQRVAYHGNYNGQCSVPVAYYAERLTGSRVPSMANDRADGWGVSFPASLAPYFNHESFRSGVAYPKGTILMWNSPHIAIVLSHNGGGMVQVFEQNADPDGSVCHVANRTLNTSTRSCIYALVPIVQASVQPVDSPVYDGSVVTVQPGWGLSQVAAAAGFADANVPSRWQVIATLNGWNDWQAFNASLKIGQVIKTGITPAPIIAPPPPPPAPPAAPISSPSTADTYFVINGIPGYLSSGNAAARTNSNSTVPGSDNYYVYNRFNGMINITHKPGQPGWWINPADNVVPAVPPPVVQPEPVSVAAPTLDPTPPLPVWKTTYVPLRPDRRGVRYVATIPLLVRDQDSRGPDQQLAQYKEIAIFGTFTKDGVLYGRPQLKDDTGFGFWYGVSMINPKTNNPNLLLESDVYDPKTDTATRKTVHSLQPRDYFVMFTAALQKVGGSFKSLFSGIFGKDHKTKK